MALDAHFQAKGMYTKFGVKGNVVIERVSPDGKVFHNVLVIRIDKQEFVIDAFKSFDKDGKCRNPNFPNRTGQVIVMTYEDFSKQFPKKPPPMKN